MSADVSMDLLVAQMKSIGLNVVFEEMEFNTMLAKRANTGPVDQGGWSIFPTWGQGIDSANPLTNQYMSAQCYPTAFPGWACDPKLEELRATFAKTVDLDARKKIAEQIQLQSLKLVPIVPTGQFFQPVAYSKKLSNVGEGPYAFTFWGVKKN